VHHVFPKALLYHADYAKKLVNAVGNFAFLTGDCNRKLGMRAPSDYFKQVAAVHPGALESQWMHEAHRCVAFHAIDQDVGEFLDLRIIQRAKTSYGPNKRLHRLKRVSDASTTA
jgi:hypothetical protein